MDGVGFAPFLTLFLLIVLFALIVGFIVALLISIDEYRREKK